MARASTTQGRDPRRLIQALEDALRRVPGVSSLNQLIDTGARVLSRHLSDELSRLSDHLQIRRNERRWQRLREMGMTIGRQVNLPASTWIDTSHCHLISIGDFCGFGEGCLILAHDAMCNEWLDATRLGRVTIHESCHFGARTVILPGVDIGPRVIVGAGSVVTKSIPPNSVAVGNPAKVVCRLDDLLDKQRARMKDAAIWQYEQMDPAHMSEAFRQNMREVLQARDGFSVGGMRATRQGRGNAVTS